MARYGIVSLLPRPDPRNFAKFEDLYNAFGWNTGNLLFTNAVWHQLAGDKTRLGFVFDPARPNDELDAVVIPAANWVRSNAAHDDFMDRLAACIEGLRIPVVVIGIGAQETSTKSAQQLSRQVGPGVRRFLRAVSERSSSISTRGAFTFEVLKGMGFNSCRVTGCPSLAYDLGGGESRTKAPLSLDRCLIHSTRYFAGPDFYRNPSVHRDLYRFAFEQKLDFLFQSEPEELAFLFGMSDMAGAGDLCGVYGCRDRSEIHRYVAKHGRTYLDVNEWSTNLRNYQFVSGTRLHSTIMALNSGVPATLLCHDSRTQEVAEFAAIPSLATYREPISASDLHNQYQDCDIDRYYARRTEIREIFRTFMEENGLLVA